VYFATHALLPEENTLAQPAIVLTPPATATAEDDGLLTADEIAGLRLNADWVVLSACNTVGPLGRGLSGLARAFLFAGAKALLVSHWYVASDATAGLISSMFEIYALDPAMGRSEALRRAMLKALDGAAAPMRTHPVFWAPFMVVGDGGPAG
jgi:CHAT domain-containing protein